MVDDRLIAAEQRIADLQKAKDLLAAAHHHEMVRADTLQHDLKQARQTLRDAVEQRDAVLMNCCPACYARLVGSDPLPDETES